MIYKLYFNKAVQNIVTCIKWDVPPPGKAQAPTLKTLTWKNAWLPSTLEKVLPVLDRWHSVVNLKTSLQIHQPCPTL